MIERAPTRRGYGLMRALLGEASAGGYTRSKAERSMRSLLRDARLPPADINVHVLGYLIDFLWRRERLVVEVDGYGAHGNRGAFERDRRRDQVLVAAGYRVVQVTWRQLTTERYAVTARLAQALAVVVAA